MTLPPLIDIGTWALIVLIGGGIVVLAWHLTKEKREKPLEDETDLGRWWIPLPGLGYILGRLTTARKTAEKHLETAISNAENTEEAEVLQKGRDAMLLYHLYAFKGSGNWLITTNHIFEDEKMFLPMGDGRLLKTPKDIIDKGEYDGFHVIHLEMPDPDQLGVKPEEREKLEALPEALKFLRTAAENKEVMSHQAERIKSLESRIKVTLKEARERASGQIIAETAAGLTLLSGEKPKVKAAWRTRVAEVLSGYRIICTGLGGFLGYVVSTRMFPNVEPLIHLFPLTIVGLVAFFIYPHIAKRL